MNYSQIMDIHVVCPVGADLIGGESTFKSSIFMRCAIKYPRACQICFRSYSTKSSFSNHKKRCKPPSDDNPRAKYPRACQICFRSYSTKSSFSNHKKRCKPPSDDNPRIKYPRACQICFRFYSTRSSFSIHKKHCKPPSDDNSNENNSSIYICKTCNKSCTTYSGVFKHNRICGKELNRKTYHPCPLPDCAAKFRHISHINRHLSDSHGFQMNLLSEEHKFKSMAEFELWLNTEEVKTCTSFKKCCGSRTKNNKTYSYYVCHFYPRSESKSVFLTEDNVNKIHPNIMCPARIMVHEESECVKAIFYRRHNHEVFQKCEISTPETEL
ncbi:zinc finger and BTB domain-containing protein 41-like isoform X1 [Stegodyphus dumicola]|uniref:zinc finger and BTB domain-containing protein 41-like isoform X1 n=1 Tax=Stegodyphus dumicola TaxID=202533 RepID=UPI0015A98EDD|nr:zinc finger and BTB domain-containing protein 41-like isoform X1 [Stegodyphus dumicola]XP_035206968.1 zinc finger and BTB domain-containing protein 41-like isoform X1 [Stegodyphus dumicola]XP_035206969.1 zinc finger and BTB domain-containing protein 41-like isoform X1 [Stegodyphus dumicola]XP_035206970.1 zinc finger and BTB domain-containing protein 41-like isoform X1 [Stegodyphus dumicola]XP_035206971.1 zinc finger and BTB domain-containing protein 41-like isoform X1 [Stegodyphus dumicola]